MTIIICCHFPSGCCICIQRLPAFFKFYMPSDGKWLDVRCCYTMTQLEYNVHNYTRAPRWKLKLCARIIGQQTGKFGWHSDFYRNVKLMHVCIKSMIKCGQQDLIQIIDWWRSWNYIHVSVCFCTTKYSSIVFGFCTFKSRINE